MVLKITRIGKKGGSLRPRKIQVKPWTIAILFGLLFIVACGAIIFIAFKKKAPAIIPPVKPVQAEANNPLPRAFTEIVKKGQTISNILMKYGFSAGDIDRLRAQTKPVFDLNRIISGRQMKLIPDPSGKIQTLEYGIDADRYLRVTREDDHFAAEIRPYPIETRYAFIFGIVEDNVISAFHRQNEADKIAIDMTDLFGWDIDFNTELRQGDTFRLVYEKKFLDGEFVGYGNILAAEFVCQGKILRAFRFEYPDTKKADYFDPDGQSLRKEFLRSPLPYARITSRFSLRRFHPIEKVYRPHYGVDYGAPIGTEVQATAEGIVVFAGLNGLSGRMVRIRHRNDYETMYLHLQRILVRPGERVRGGQIIGTVGSSGESTGPHLDYRIKKGGGYVNPLSWKFSPVAPLRPEFKEAFKKEVVVLELTLDAPLLALSAWLK
jgi:murein DD-endopeptidase MepM/ murein hydrolase activator NlpD